MLASENEFFSLLKQALNGAGLSTGDYTGTSLQILSAAKMGLVDWDEFPSVLDRLLSKPSQPEYPITEVDPRYKQQSELNGASLGVFATQLGDFSIAHGIISNIATARLHNCRDFEFLIPTLTEAAERGLSGSFFWQDEHSIHQYEINQGDHYPSYYTAPSMEELPFQSCVMVLVLNTKKYTSYMNRYWSQLLEQRSLQIDASVFTARHEQSILAGIDVPNSVWRRLQEMACLSRVANSEQSRQGAG